MKKYFLFLISRIKYDIMHLETRKRNTEKEIPMNEGLVIIIAADDEEGEE